MRYPRWLHLLGATLALQLSTLNLLWAQSEVSFTRRDLGAGGSAQSVAAGDFNGDARQDVVVGGSVVAILLGRGDGTFQTAQDTGLEPSPLVTVGDLNGDGRQDLIAAAMNGVFVSLGNGDGTFQVPRGAGVFPPSPVAIAVGDFNGDSQQDLATAHGAGSAAVSILLGNGDGTFEPARALLVDNYYNSVTVGDFNGDSQQDLAAAGFLGSSVVSIFLGQGDGTFEPPQDFGVGFAPVPITVGDFNGDGQQDLATANGMFVSTIFTVSILLGQGDGTFEPAQDFGVGRDPASITVGDFNGDGQQDLVTANVSGGAFHNGSVSILLGRGDGTFESPQDFVVGQGPRFSSVTVGDFNGDGQQDVATANGAASTELWPDQQLSILINLTAAEITTYRLTRIDIGDAPFRFPDIRDINELGEMGGAVVSETEPSRAILLRTGMVIELGDLAGGAAQSAVATAINDRSQITGSNKIQEASGNLVDRGFLWEDGQIRDLDVPGAIPNDINNRGQIVGTTLGTDDLVWPFLWEAGQTRLLETLDRPECPSPELRVDALRINSQGIAVGYSRSPAGFRAVIWQNREIMSLEPPIPMANGGASGVNDQGDVIGSYSSDSLAHPRCMLCAGGVVKSFLWQPGGDAIELLPLERAGAGSAALVSSINYQGQIVGDTRTTILSQPNGTIATLWQDGAVRELNELISDDEPLKGEVNLFSAIEINEAGVIVARGLEAGLGFTYVLTPTGMPAPTSATAPPAAPSPPPSASPPPASDNRGGGAIDRVSLLLLLIVVSASAACARRRRLAVLVARRLD